MLSRTWWLLDNFIVCCTVPEWSHLPLPGSLSVVTQLTSDTHLLHQGFCCPLGVDVQVPLLSAGITCVHQGGENPWWAPRSSLSWHSQLWRSLISEPFILLGVVSTASCLLGSAVLLLRCLASRFTVHVYMPKCLHPASPTSCSVPVLGDGTSYFLSVPQHQFLTSLPADSKWSKPSQITYVQAQLRPAIWKFRKKFRRYKNVNGIFLVFLKDLNEDMKTFYKHFMWGAAKEGVVRIIANKLEKL